MKRLIFILLAAHYSLPIAYPQISYNMYLLANVDKHPAPHGYSIGITGYKAPDGREYAVLGCNIGTSFVDITDSANVREVGFQKGISSDWRDMKIWSHYAYIVGDVVGCNLQIVDLQYLPDSIHYVTSYFFPGFTRAHTLEQSGPYLYVNGGDYRNGGVFILDLTINPEMPVKRGEWENLNVHDCRIVNDTIWSCNAYSGRITVINASNKNNLRTITSWCNGQNPVVHNCALTDDSRYLFVTDETFNPPGRLKIWNVSDLGNVQFITSWHPPGIDSAAIHNVEIYGNFAVLAYYTAGIRVLDISNPEFPVEAAWHDTYPADNGNSWNGCKGIYMLPSGKIIANDKQTGLYVVRTSFPLIGSGNSKTVSKDFVLYQNYPNPFNPVTKIKFDISSPLPPSKGEFVSLRVFNILGREIAILINQPFSPGTYDVPWNASNFPGGIYFCQLSARDASTSLSVTETKKMVLLK